MLLASRLLPCSGFRGLGGRHGCQRRGCGWICQARAPVRPAAGPCPRHPERARRAAATRESRNTRGDSTFSRGIRSRSATCSADFAASSRAAASRSMRSQDRGFGGPAAAAAAWAGPGKDLPTGLDGAPPDALPVGFLVAHDRQLAKLARAAGLPGGFAARAAMAASGRSLDGARSIRWAMRSRARHSSRAIASVRGERALRPLTRRQGSTRGSGGPARRTASNSSAAQPSRPAAARSAASRFQLQEQFHVQCRIGQPGLWQRSSRPVGGQVGLWQRRCPGSAPAWRTAHPVQPQQAAGELGVEQGGGCRSSSARLGRSWLAACSTHLSVPRISPRAPATVRRWGR